MLTETSKKIQAKEPNLVVRKIFKFALVILAAYTVGHILSRSANSVERSPIPAGFGTGVLHGAMMPCAMPNLLFGKDVSIYAQNNNGNPYKLGYTVGVNLCGLAFFGYSFYRLSRLKKTWAQKNTDVAE